MSFGSSKSKSSVTDLSPQPFVDLRQPFADVLGSLFGTPGQSGMPTGPGTASAPATGNENAILAALMQTLGQTGQPGGSSAAVDFLTKMLQQSSTPANTAVGAGAPQSIDGFLSSITGATGYQPNQSLPDFLKALSGVGAPQGRDLGQLTAGVNAASTQPGYSPDGNNPFMTAAIEAATRPLLQGLEETLTRSLPGRFTSAGQFTQPQGSSAFDRAAAIATRGVAQEIGDISSQISYQGFEAERQRQFQAEEGARQREAETIAAELERQGRAQEAHQARQFEGFAQELARRGEFEEAARMRESTMLAAELERRGQHEEAARVRAQQAAQFQQQQQTERTGQQITAAQSIPQITQQEVSTLVQNLQAQALPRLIQEMGIERANAEFNNRMQQLLTLLGITADVTAPTTGQNSSSKSRQIGIPAPAPIP